MNTVIPSIRLYPVASSVVSLSHLSSKNRSGQTAVPHATSSLPAPALTSEHLPSALSRARRSLTPVATATAQPSPKQRLSNASSQAQSILAQQPQLEQTTADLFMTEIRKKFPALSESSDPEQIIIESRENRHGSSQAVRTTLMEVLRDTLKTGKVPAYVNDDARFFHGTPDQPGAAIPGMRADMFEDIVRKFSQDVGHQYKQQVLNYYQDSPLVMLGKWLDTQLSNVGEQVDLDRIYVNIWTEGPPPKVISSLSLTQIFENFLRDGDFRAAPSFQERDGTTRMGFFGSPVATSGNIGATGGKDSTVYASMLAVMSYLKHTFSLDSSADLQQTRIEQLGKLWMEQLGAEMRLRGNTLSRDALGLLDDLFVQYRDSRQAQPTGEKRVGLFELYANNTPVPGAFIVTSSPLFSPSNAQGPLLLIMPGQGIMEFDSATKLQDTFTAWLQDPQQRSRLLPYLPDQHNAFSRSPSLTYRTINAPVFDDRIQSQLDQQSKNIQSHVTDKGLLPLDTDLWADDTLSPIFDQHAILQAVQVARLWKSYNDFLTTYKPSDADRQALFSAQNTYLKALQTSATEAGLPSAHQYGDPAFLRAYAKQQLKERIWCDKGVEIDPDQIRITVKQLQHHVNKVPSGRPGVPPLQPQWVDVTTTLTQLALDNVPKLELDYWAGFAVISGEGQSIAQLSSSYLKQIVRELNVGQSYADYLKTRLLPIKRETGSGDIIEGSSAGDAREKQFVAQLSGSMQVDAIQAKIAGDLGPAHTVNNRSDSLHERGLKWIQAVLNGAGTDAPIVVDGHTLTVNQLQLNGATLRGIQMIGPTQDTAIPDILIYTPDAPDGKRFRYFANRAEMLAKLLKDPALRDYLVSRADLGSQKEVRRLLDRGPRGPELSTPIIGNDFLKKTYRAEVMYALSNADAQSTTTLESNRQEAWNSANVAVDVVSAVLPLKILAPLALGRSLLSVWNGVDAVKRGEGEEALTAFIDAALHLVDLGTDLGGTQIGLGKKRSRPAHTLLPAGNQLTLGRVDLEGYDILRPESITAKPNGIYDGPNQTQYVEITQKWYQVEFRQGGYEIIPSPGANRYAYERFPIIRDASTGQWRVLPRGEGVGGMFKGFRKRLISRRPSSPTPEGVATTSSTFNKSLYELSSPEDIQIIGSSSNVPHFFKREYFFEHQPIKAARARFFERYDQLLKDAESELPTLQAAKTRPSTPELQQDGAPQSWIKDIYQKTDGIVVGEDHSDIGAKQFIVDNIKTFKKEGVKTLYVEHLTSEQHGKALAQYFKKKGTMPGDLAEYLQSWDKKGKRIRDFNEGLLDDPDGKYTFFNLVKTAVENDIEVIPIDSLPSYLGENRGLPRIKAMNYYGQGVINARQQVKGGKWIAFVGNAHANTYKGVPGVAELTGGIGIRVEDIAGNQATIKSDPGFVAAFVIGEAGSAQVKSDYLLQMPTKKPPASSTSTTQLALSRVGQFILEVSEQGQVLKHYSRNGSIVITPINVDSDGKFFINRPEWPEITGKRYARLDDLASDLARKGLKQVLP